MCTVPNQARLLLLTAEYEDITYRMSMISARMQLNSSKQMGVSQTKSDIRNQKLQELIDSGMENVTAAQISALDIYTTDQDTELVMLEIQDEQLETELKSLETKAQQIKAEKDELEKTQTNSIKNEFNTFGKN